MSIDGLNLSPFYEAYLLSNNGVQLYRQFSRLVSPSDLWTVVDSDRIVEEFNKEVRDTAGEFDGLIRAYIILVAVTKLARQDADEILDGLAVGRLQWGTTIRTIYDQAARSTSLFYMKTGPHVQQPGPSANRNSSRTVQIQGIAAPGNTMSSESEASTNRREANE